MAAAKNKPVEMTMELARATAQDAGNRSMRKAGRTSWSKADYNVAAREFNRLWPESRDIENPSAFDRCVESVSARGSADDPRAVCAAAGRRKYGAKRFQAMAAAGRRRAAKRNPLEAAADLAEAWHGRPANKVTEITERLHTHGVLVDLGGMECLEIVDPNDERYVIPVKFGHDVRLASNEQGNQLYLLGGDQTVDVEPFGVEVDKDLVVLGEAAAITYHTSKAHLGKADKIPGPYRHVFADERNGERPTVLYECLNHLVQFAGGTYKIERDMGRYSAGIRN